METWGFEYVKNLAGEIGKEWDHRIEAGQGTDDLKALVEEIVPFNIKHNSEPEACDLLMEVELLPDILEYVNENNYNRVALYLLNCANYVPEPEDSVVFNTVYQIYLKVNRYPEAMRIAIRLNSDKLAQVFDLLTSFTHSVTDAVSSRRFSTCAPTKKLSFSFVTCLLGMGLSLSVLRRRSTCQ